MSCNMSYSSVDSQANIMKFSTKRRSILGSFVMWFQDIHVKQDDSRVGDWGGFIGGRSTNVNVRG